MHSRILHQEISNSLECQAYIPLMFIRALVNVVELPNRNTSYDCNMGSIRASISFGNPYSLTHSAAAGVGGRYPREEQDQ